jgi:hypothetical protein
MKRLILSAIFSLSFCLVNLSAQTVLISAYTALPTQTISVPVTASGFPNNIGSVELRILVNTSVVQCTGYTQGTLTGGILVNVNANPIVISWITGATSINGTMITLNFKYKGGTTALDLTSACEIVSGVVPFDVIPTTYTDGSMSAKATTTYYVDETVSSSGNGLSWATALKKISEATNKSLQPGDKVLIDWGNYNTDTVVIKSNGTEIQALSFGVSVSDTNKITFPASADLSYVDIVDYPNSYYAYVNRSWKGNNGVYKITSVDKAAKWVRVEGAEFVPETGAVSDSSLLQAAIGFPVIYEKSATTPVSQRVVLSSAGVTNERATMHIGKPTASGDFNVTPANFNIIDGIDLTGADQIGLKVQNSKFNVFKNGRIYEMDSIGVLISGNSTNPAIENFILNNQIYNTKNKAVKIGIQAETAANNRAYLNTIKGNEIYSTGAGTNINFKNGIDICRYTAYNVIEANVLRNFKLNTVGRGVIEVKNNVRRVLAYSNYIKNIDRVNTGTHGLFYLQNTGTNISVYNNVLADSAALDNDIYAFWVDASTGTYTAGLIGYNTVHRVDNGFNLLSSSSAVDFTIKNNIMNIDATAPAQFTTSGTGLYSVSYNCYSTIPTSYAGETGRLVGDPGFLQPTYFQGPTGCSLTASSICLNTGNPISAVSSDFLKKTRNASAPSRGAYENVVTTAYWTGDVGTGWNNFRNWDLWMVPLTTYNVIIPDKINDPVIQNGSVTIKSLQIRSGATLRIVSPRILTITN